MTAAGHSRIATASRAVAPVAGLFLAFAVLLRFPPQQYSFYPRCPIFALFHLQCPGCGATRALAALLNGHLREALHLNALSTVAFPLGFLWAARCYRRYLAREPIRWPLPSQAAIYAALTITAVFAIARNL